MAKSKLRLDARDLRKKGFGIKIIARTLGVSASTVSLWCHDIVLSLEQIAELERRAHDPYYGRRLLYAQKQREERLRKTKVLFEAGRSEVGRLNGRELFVAGIALYWAEGFKKDTLVGFSNSDFKMILFFVRWLESLGIKKTTLKFRLAVNESHKDRVNTIQTYWETTIDVKRNQFQKPFFQQVKWQKIYDDPEAYHGVLRVRVPKSTALLRKLHGWIAGLSE